jgi:hypothetical protein
LSEVLTQEVAPLGIKVTVAEPGGMRTGRAGSSMETPPVSAPYEAVVGAAIAAIRGADGKQPGDPERISRILLDITEAEEPPLRLLLGKDAVPSPRPWPSGSPPRTPSGARSANPPPRDPATGVPRCPHRRGLGLPQPAPGAGRGHVP